MRNNFDWAKVKAVYPLTYTSIKQWCDSNNKKFEGVLHRESTYSVGRETRLFTPHGIQWLQYYLDNFGIVVVIDTLFRKVSIHRVSKLCGANYSEEIASIGIYEPMSRLEIECLAYLEALNYVENMIIEYGKEGYYTGFQDSNNESISVGDMVTDGTNTFTVKYYLGNFSLGFDKAIDKELAQTLTKISK